MRTRARSLLISLILVTLVVGVTAAGRLIDVPRAVGGIKGDEATYVAMAFSLAHDHDLVFQRRDLDRFFMLYGQGPEGIFLKRRYRARLDLTIGWPPVSVVKTAVPVAEGLAYGKALAYPLAAAPFALVGGLGGMLLFNWILLAACLWCAARFCQMRTGRPVVGACLGIVFIAASVVPVYGAWLTSEMFNFSVVFFAYFLWLYKRAAATPAAGSGWLGHPATDLAAAMLLGVAAYSKATNVLLVGPMVAVALATRRWKLAIGMLVLFMVAAGSLVALNVYVSGEPNYQGGDRKTFYGRYPFSDAAAIFGDRALGSLSATDDADTKTVLDPQVLALLPRNAFYFLAGRDAGLIPFYFPGVLIAVLWLTRWRRAPLWQWTTFLACLASVAGLLIEFPYFWNGGGGPPGNRYFLSLYPTLLFLVPAGIGLSSVMIAGVVGVTFTGAMVIHPFTASNEPWHNVERAPLRWLPIELTLINDLPVRLYPRQQRGPIAFWTDPKPVVLFYYMDGNTYFAEGDGLWIAGHAATDIIIRTERPLTGVGLAVTSKHVPNNVHVTIGGSSADTTIAPDSTATLWLMPRLGVWAHDSYGYVLSVSTTNGFVPKNVERGSTDTRNLGVFIQPTFAVEPPPKAPDAGATRR